MADSLKIVSIDLISKLKDIHSGSSISNMVQFSNIIKRKDYLLACELLIAKLFSIMTKFSIRSWT